MRPYNPSNATPLQRRVRERMQHCEEVVRGNDRDQAKLALRELETVFTRPFARQEKLWEKAQTEVCALGGSGGYAKSYCFAHHGLKFQPNAAPVKDEAIYCDRPTCIFLH